MQTLLHLRSQNFGVRLGLTLLCLVLAGGFAASATHLFFHDQKRDERPGLTIDDVKGVYHGIRTRAPLLVALERKHPAALKDADRDRLMKWLTGKRISEDYDNTDLGENAPAEIIAKNCISCHTRESTDAAAKKVPLQFFDDVRALATSRDVSPNSVEIITASTHVHAISLATLSCVLALLISFTRFRGAFAGLLVALSGVGLLCDIGGWWLARSNDQFAYMIVAGGAAYFASSLLLILLIVADLWLPARK